MRTLLVEDDQQFGDRIAEELSRAGFAVQRVADPDTLRGAISSESESFGLMVLDIGAAGDPRLEMLRWLRTKGPGVPLLVLTPPDAIGEATPSLDNSRDGYMVKPFRLEALVVRAQSLVRQSASEVGGMIVHGPIEMNVPAQQVKVEGRVVPLTGREFAILRELLRNVGRIMSRSELEERLYGWGQDIASNAVEVHIHHLRRKFWRGLIRTVRGVGYIVRREDA